MNRPPFHYGPGPIPTNGAAKPAKPAAGSPARQELRAKQRAAKAARAAHRARRVVVAELARLARHQARLDRLTARRTARGLAPRTPKLKVVKHAPLHHQEPASVEVPHVQVKERRSVLNRLTQRQVPG
jgi:hypothetical protein